MNKYNYNNNEESFKRFQQSKRIYSPAEIGEVTDRCDDIDSYDNIEAIFLYDSDAHIFQITDGMSTQNGPFKSTCRFIMPGYPLDIIESNNLEELERALFQLFLSNNYFDK